MVSLLRIYLLISVFMRHEINEVHKIKFLANAVEQEKQRVAIFILSFINHYIPTITHLRAE